MIERQFFLERFEDIPLHLHPQLDVALAVCVFLSQKSMSPPLLGTPYFLFGEVQSDLCFVVSGTILFRKLDVRVLFDSWHCFYPFFIQPNRRHLRCLVPRAADRCVLVPHEYSVTLECVEDWRRLRQARQLQCFVAPAMSQLFNAALLRLWFTQTLRFLLVSFLYLFYFDRLRLVCHLSLPTCVREEDSGLIEVPLIIEIGDFKQLFLGSLLLFINQVDDLLPADPTYAHILKLQSTIQTQSNRFSYKICSRAGLPPALHNIGGVFQARR